MLENNGEFVKLLEEKMAKFVCAPHAVAVDSGTNALFLLMKYMMSKGTERTITIPKRTYMSVPMAIVNAGYEPRFVDMEWEGSYRFGNVPVVDACNTFHPNMYNYPPRHVGDYMFVSFQSKKICGVNKGGMIFLDNEHEANLLRRLAFDGRDYMLGANKDNGIIIGHHMNMTPETASRILLKFNMLGESDFGVNGGSWMYRDLTEMECFDEYK